MAQKRFHIQNRRTKIENLIGGKFQLKDPDVKHKLDYTVECFIIVLSFIFLNISSPEMETGTEMTSQHYMARKPGLAINQFTCTCILIFFPL